MKGVILSGVLLLFVYAAPTPAAAQSDQSRFAGAWRLVSIEGGADRNRGPHPTGLIWYDGTGHMAVQIAPDRTRPSWAPNAKPSPQQAFDAVDGYIAYFGTYVVDPKAHTVTHRRQAALNLYAVDIVRRYELAGDRLILKPLEAANAGITLVWERIR